MAASLLSAALLFAVQPMAAKMVLPLLGGSASVWTLCMLFFQTGLLAGYGWAHFLGTRFRVRTQVLLHAGLGFAALLALPPAISGTSLPPVDSSPGPWLLAALAASFGLPYATLAATGPLLQRWFSSSGHAAAHDPYFLYAASNAGSFAGLLAYPLLLERLLPLHATTPGLTQAGLWSGGFVVLFALVVSSGVWTALRAVPAPIASLPEQPAAVDTESRLRWMALAFVPSSAMLGATQYLTTDIAAIPLFWIIPLGLYLLTFVIAFSPRIRLPISVIGIVLGVGLIAAAAEIREGPRLFGQLIFPLHLAVLAAVGLLCHGRLAAARPDRSRLTEYYFFIAVGGCAGGLFNGIVAPLVFDSIAEYPLALVLAAFLVPDPARSELSPRTRLVNGSLDLGTAVIVGAVTLAVGRLIPTSASGARWIVWVSIGVPSLLTLAVLGWPRRFAFAVLALLAMTWIAARTPWTSLHRERTFYGVHRVVLTTSPGLGVTDPDGHPKTIAQKLHVLIDGVTRHGSQSLDRERRLLPTTYYHPTGPLGDIVRGLRTRGPIADAGLIGLGAGTAAAYGDAGERFTYFEIDPAVARLAQNPAYFTYLSDSRATVSIVLGDGRRRIAEAPDASFDLIVLDAFSSDAIPVHLLTREAVTIYLRKLKPRGCLAIHLTNGYLALDRVVTAIAADLHVPAAIKHDGTRTPRENYEGKDFSTWAILARDANDPLPIEDSEGWVPTATDGATAKYLWTDDRSNLLGLLR
jgi:SAM-dependent methyltransferase